MMTIPRTLYWLAIWLLSPSRGAVLLKCVFIGIVLKLLSIVLVIPFLFTTLPTYDPTAPFSPDSVIYVTSVGNAYAVLVAPLLETIAMALVFGLLGSVFRLPLLLPGAVIVVGAVLLHHDDLVTQTVIAFVFAAFSIQYALFRTHFSASTTILGVATTHATINALGILVSRALLS